VIRGPLHQGFGDVFTPACLQFLAALQQKFDPIRRTLLAARARRQILLDKGQVPSFLPETEHVRVMSWKGASIPRDLADRRVEITGPVDAKMIINALNSGSKVFMADFEDSTSPTWINLVQGQLNLIAAVNRTLTFQDSTSGKKYGLKDEKELATLMVRPRGWHLDEHHLLVDQTVMSASLFDFGIYFFHNAKNLLNRGSGPYFYLPKMESHLEARLWNDVFVWAQETLNIPRGTIRATVLIETILAVFEMDEIIYELRDHSAGLNCGRWDYIFSFIKKFRNHKQALLPDRSLVTMTAPWMANYVRLLIQTCHRRGVHAMGGMAAQIPVKDNPELNAAAFEKVRGDKLREVKVGCDGTWVAHPGLIDIAMQVFNQHMPSPNQINASLETITITSQDLLNIGNEGTRTEAGLKSNLSVGLAYLEAWLRGSGCVPLNYLMEDAATAEISRCQVWQWIKHKATLTDGRTVDKALVIRLLDDEEKAVKQALGSGYAKRKFDLAREIYQKLLLSDELADFLTTVAYPYITTVTDSRSNL